MLLYPDTMKKKPLYVSRNGVESRPKHWTPEAKTVSLFTVKHKSQKYIQSPVTVAPVRFP